MKILEHISKQLVSKSFNLPTTWVNQRCYFTPKVSFKIPSCSLEVGGQRKPRGEASVQTVWISLCFFFEGWDAYPDSKSIYKHLLASQQGSSRRPFGWFTVSSLTNSVKEPSIAWLLLAFGEESEEKCKSVHWAEFKLTSGLTSCCLGLLLLFLLISHEVFSALHSAAPWPGLRQRMQVWKPNLHLPFFVAFLHPRFKFRCQQIGLPSFVFMWRPCSSVGTWLGTFGASTLGLLLLLFFVGALLWLGGGFPDHFSILWIGVKCTLILGSFIRRLTSWSSGGSASGAPGFKEPVYSAASKRNNSWSARRSWSKEMGLKFGMASDMRALKSLLTQSEWVSHDIRETTSNANPRLCSAYSNFNSVPMSAVGKVGEAMVFKAPCSIVTSYFCLDLASCWISCYYKSLRLKKFKTKGNKRERFIFPINSYQNKSDTAHPSF